MFTLMQTFVYIPSPQFQIPRNNPWTGGGKVGGARELSLQTMIATPSIERDGTVQTREG